MADPQSRPGDLSWRLSSHPVTLVTFLSFRIGLPLSLRPGGVGRANAGVQPVF